MTGIWTPPNAVSLVGQKSPFGGSPTPIFWVPFTDAGDGVCNINPVISYGTVTSNFVSTSDIWTRLVNGLWKKVSAGNPLAYYGCEYGQPFTGRFDGLLLPGASQNNILFNRDWTQGSWIKTNVSAVKNATGIDGVTASATTLTATAANGTVIQNLGAVNRTGGLFIRKINVTGDIFTTIDNGATWVSVLSSLINFGSEWSSLPINLGGSTPFGLGIKFANSGDSIAVDFAYGQPYIGGQQPWPIIETAGVAVTTNDSSILYTPSNSIVYDIQNFSIGVRAWTAPFSASVLNTGNIIQLRTDAGNFLKLGYNPINYYFNWANDTNAGNIAAGDTSALTDGRVYSAFMSVAAGINYRLFGSNGTNTNTAGAPLNSSIVANAIKLGLDSVANFNGTRTYKDLLVYNTPLDQDSFANLQLPIFPYNT